MDKFILFCIRFVLSLREIAEMVGTVFAKISLYMEQSKKFISPGAWFSMTYPADWNEFEDGEGSFLFYNPNEWTGNFRISAFKGNATYGKDSVKQELRENSSAIPVRIGRMECAYSKEMFEEEGAYYTIYG